MLQGVGVELANKEGDRVDDEKTRNCQAGISFTNTYGTRKNPNHCHHCEEKIRQGPGEFHVEVIRFGTGHQNPKSSFSIGIFCRIDPNIHRCEALLDNEQIHDSCCGNAVIKSFSKVFSNFRFHSKKNSQFRVEIAASKVKTSERVRIEIVEDKIPNIR